MYPNKTQRRHKASEYASLAVGSETDIDFANNLFLGYYLSACSIMP